jgi:hypothetical protein
MWNCSGVVQILQLRTEKGSRDPDQPLCTKQSTSRAGFFMVRPSQIYTANLHMNDTLVTVQGSRFGIGISPKVNLNLDQHCTAI